MPIRNPADLAQSLPAKGALIGLDLGTKTIGVGVSNPERTLASPRETIRRTKLKADIEHLALYAKMAASEEGFAEYVGKYVKAEQAQPASW